MIIEVMHVWFKIKLIIKRKQVDLKLYEFEVDQHFLQSKNQIIVLERSPFGPELSIANNTEYHVQAGELIELPCGISSYSSNAKISWWKDGKQISNMNQDFLILQISYSSVNDSGMYICQIDDDESIGRFTSIMFLKVHRKWNWVQWMIYQKWK